MEEEKLSKFPVFKKKSDSSELVGLSLTTNPPRRVIQNQLGKEVLENLSSFSLGKEEKRFLMNLNEEVIGVIDLVSFTCDFYEQCNDFEEECPLLNDSTCQVVVPWMSDEVLNRISRMKNNKPLDALGFELRTTFEKIGEQVKREGKSLLVVEKKDKSNVAFLLNLFKRNGFKGYHECNKYKIATL